MAPVQCKWESERHGSDRQEGQTVAQKQPPGCQGCGPRCWCLDLRRCRAAHRSREAVAPLGKGLQKPRMFRIVFQGGADLTDSVVQTLLEIYERLRAPDLLSQVLPGDDFPWPAYQQRQNFGRLRLKL